MKRERPDWVCMNHEGFLCLRCGDIYRMTMPCSLNVMAGASRGFLTDHRHCRPRKEPTP